MNIGRSLYVALSIGLAGASGMASAQTDLTVGDTFMWDGTGWVAVNLSGPMLALPTPVQRAPAVTPVARPAPVVHAPRPAPQPVWTAPRPTHVEVPTRSRTDGFQPSWLLGVFR